MSICVYRVLKDDGEFIFSLPIEIGFSLILRQIMGRFAKFRRDNCTFKELIQNGILKKPHEQKNIFGHKNFDWCVISKKLIKKFIKIQTIYSLISSLGLLSPTIIFKLKKRTS